MDQLNNFNDLYKQDADEKDNLFSDISSNSFRSRSRSKEYSDKYDKIQDRLDEDKRFIMKNGCCRDCMRAFSKSGKSCLCQVPKFERKYTLPDKGCNFCGCHGCNPVDVRRDKRKELKKQLKDDKNILYKKQRLLDSDDEELKVYNTEADDWNKTRKDLFKLISDNVNSSAYFMGYGVPLRTTSYILGYQPFSEDKKKRGIGRKRNFKNDNDNTPNY